MSLVIQSAPGSEPVTTAEAKAHARVTTSSDDTYIGALITAARVLFEALTSRSLISQTLDYRLDGFPCDSTEPIELPRAGGQLLKSINTVSSISYVDTDGNTQTWGTSNYTADIYSVPARIVPAYSIVWPTTRAVINAVTVRFTVGETAASTVDENIKLAIKQLVSHWYRRREPVGVNISAAEIPMTTMALIDQFKWNMLR